MPSFCAHKQATNRYIHLYIHDMFGLFWGQCACQYVHANMSLSMIPCTMGWHISCLKGQCHEIFLHVLQGTMHIKQAKSVLQTFSFSKDILLQSLKFACPSSFR